MEIDNWGLNVQNLVYALYALVNNDYTINDNYANNIVSNNLENAGDLTNFTRGLYFYRKQVNLQTQLKIK